MNIVYNIYIQQICIKQTKQSGQVYIAIKVTALQSDYVFIS